MRTELLLALLVLAGCNESRHKAPSDTHGQFAEICTLEDGDIGYTTSWAFTGSYPVFDSPGGTLDTRVAREGNNIIFKGQTSSRSDWGCDRAPSDVGSPVRKGKSKAAGVEI